MIPFQALPVFLAVLALTSAQISPTFMRDGARDVYPEVPDKSFTRLSYAQILHRLRLASLQKPDLIEMFDGNAKFGLPSVGTCDEYPAPTQPSDAADPAGATTKVPCKVWVVQLGNKELVKPRTPRMIVSGELHGNERVGPVAILEFLEFVLALHDQSTWVRYFVDTRLITLIPMTNAHGYNDDIREEIGENDHKIDINRDFPFDQSPTACMTSVAARVVNELFLSTLYRLMITFHAGTNVLGYEWGDLGHCTRSDGGKMDCIPAPDRAAMMRLADRMKTFAGPTADTPEYVVGDMSSTVYPVGGGMEDWAYGASWSVNPKQNAPSSVPCEPAPINGSEYSSQRTTYDGSTHRCITYLVETSENKDPSDEQLGGSNGIWSVGGNESGTGDRGHIARNMRLLFAAADSIDPYSTMHTAEWAEEGNGGNHLEGGNVEITWSIHGVFDVDETYLQWAVPSDLPDQEAGLHGGTAAQSGEGSFWAGEYFLEGKIFRATIPVLPIKTSDVVHFRVSYKVDAALAEIQKDAGLPPQSHFVNLRNNASWRHHNSDTRIRGESVRFSSTLIVRPSTAGGKPFMEFKSEEDGSWGGRLTPSEPETGGALSSPHDNTSSKKVNWLAMTLIVAGSLLAVVLVALFVRWIVIRLRHRRAANHGQDEEDGEEMNELMAPLWDEDSD